MANIPPVMPALITPFDGTGAFDPEAHTRNVTTVTAAGIGGVLVAGSNGEGPYLEPGERAALCAGVRAATPDAYLLCGVAAESLRGALAQAEEAAAGGADAVLVTTPTSLVRGRHGLVAGFYADAADRSPLPVALYSVPKVTGYELPLDVAADLAAHPNITAMKDSSGHPGRAAALAEHLTVLAGSSAAAALSVAGGAAGVVTASANYAPRLVIDVVAAAARSLTEALPLQRQLTALSAAVERHGVPGVKAAAARFGLHPGTVRRPLQPLGEAEQSAVAAAYDEAFRSEG
jgi:dihydrodipicolinate synthase/N-acetylneuraminate lyase